MTPDEADAAQIMLDRWRDFAAGHVRRPESTTSHADQLAMLRHAMSTANHHLLPPKEGLFGKLSAIANKWTTDWTFELRASGSWAKQQLQAIRQLIANRELDKAIRELETMIADACPSTRPIVVAGQVRTEQGNESRPSDQQLTDGLNNLVRWLAGL